MFKRDSVDIIDLTDLHKRKLIKLPEKENQEISNKMTNDGFFDFSNNKATPETVNETSKVETKQEDFLSSFASIGSQESEPRSQEIKKETSDNEEVKNLTWRLENLEFKLEQLIERVNSLRD